MGGPAERPNPKLHALSLSLLARTSHRPPGIFPVFVVPVGMLPRKSRGSGFHPNRGIQFSMHATIEQCFAPPTPSGHIRNKEGHVRLGLAVPSAVLRGICSARAVYPDPFPALAYTTMAQTPELARWPATNKSHMRKCWERPAASSCPRKPRILILQIPRQAPDTQASHVANGVARLGHVRKLRPRWLGRSERRARPLDCR